MHAAHLHRHGAIARGATPADGVARHIGERDHRRGRQRQGGRYAVVGAAELAGRCVGQPHAIQDHIGGHIHSHKSLVLGR